MVVNLHEITCRLFFPAPKSVLNQGVVVGGFVRTVFVVRIVFACLFNRQCSTDNVQTTVSNRQYSTDNAKPTMFKQRCFTDNVQPTMFKPTILNRQCLADNIQPTILNRQCSNRQYKTDIRNPGFFFIRAMESRPSLAHSAGDFLPRRVLKVHSDLSVFPSFTNSLRS